MIKDHNLKFDVAFTSVLKRAIKTLYTIQDVCDLHWIPVHRCWRLNERMYGALQGFNKSETAAKHGEAQVKVWLPFRNGVPFYLQKCLVNLNLSVVYFMSSTTTTRIQFLLVFKLFLVFANHALCIIPSCLLISFLSKAMNNEDIIWLSQ